MQRSRKSKTKAEQKHVRRTAREFLGHDAGDRSTVRPVEFCLYCTPLSPAQNSPGPAASTAQRNNNEMQPYSQDRKQLPPVLSLGPRQRVKDGRAAKANLAWIALLPPQNSFGLATQSVSQDSPESDPSLSKSSLFPQKHCEMDAIKSNRGRRQTVRDETIIHWTKQKRHKNEEAGAATSDCLYF